MGFSFRLWIARAKKEAPRFSQEARIAGSGGDNGCYRLITLICPKSRSF
jgi:hypothetical protein